MTLVRTSARRAGRQRPAARRPLDDGDEARSPRGARPRRHRPPLDLLIGFVTNFFDTLGIGSFATTTAAFRLFRLVPDELIPGTIIVGDALPVLMQALLFISVVAVDPWQMTALDRGLRRLAAGSAPASSPRCRAARCSSAWAARCWWPPRSCCSACSAGFRRAAPRWRSRRGRSRSRSSINFVLGCAC